MGGKGEKSKKLTVPFCQESKDERGHYSVSTLEKKTVRDYTGYDFDRIGALTVFEFWLYLRDAIIYNCQQSSEGKEYLEKCWAAEQTAPDRAALRKLFRKGG